MATLGEFHIINKQGIPQAQTTKQPLDDHK